MSDYLTLEEAAEFLGTSRTTLYRWLRTGKVPGHKLGRRWRFLRSELDELRRGAPTSEGRGATGAEELIWDAADAGADAVHVLPVGEGFEVRRRTAEGLRTVAILSPEAFADLDREWSRRSRPVREAGKRRLFLARDGGGVRRLQVRYRRLETFAGERVTLRLLPEDPTRASIDRIAPRAEDASALRRLCALRRGVVLVSGRSGSGRTTTAYACLAEAAAAGSRVVFTLEEAVGTFLPGVDQVEVALDDERAVRAAFEAVMDSDPDVLFAASASTRAPREALWGLCLSAAETGHLVFVQLEAEGVEDAAGTFISALDRPPGDHLVGGVWQEVVRGDGPPRARFEFLA